MHQSVSFVSFIFTLYFFCCFLGIGGASCPSGWVPFQNHSHCYKFGSDLKTWSESQKQCKQYGADLVKISSKAENDFVFRNKKTANAWLGLHRGSDHKFYWTDGTKPVYVKWSPGEPNDAGRIEDCGHMWNHRRDGSWNDHQCSTKMSYVCEKSPKTCGSNNGGCSHKCVNTAGGYRCECPDPELTLSQDKHTCVASGVKVSCGPDQMAIDIPKSILDNIHKQDLTLNSKSCGAKENSTHFSLVAPLNGCGTVSKETKYQIVYTNKVLETAVANGSIITRVRPVEITFSCSYPRHETISAVGHKPIYTKLKFTERENGTLFHALALDIFPNNKFKTPFKKLPAPVKLRKLLYIQASLKSADKQLSINTERCFATPKRDPYSKPAHNLIVNSCPVDHGVTFLPSPTRNVRRFSVKAFKLVGPSKKFVFIHCDILICNAADANSACTKQCKSGSQQRKREYTGTAKQTVTGGPMTFEDETLAELEFGNDVDREDSLPMDTDTEIDNYYT